LKKHQRLSESLTATPSGRSAQSKGPIVIKKPTLYQWAQVN